MEAITIYKAEDGSRFDNEIKCLEYELMCKQVSEIIKPLGKRPEGCDFSNGAGYIQHEDPQAVKIEFAKYLLKHQPDLEAAKKIVNGEDVHMSWIDRFTYGMGECISHAVFRLRCINFNSKREYGQPYFVAHESEVKQIQLNN